MSAVPGDYPGYHMNKRHWNTLILDGSLPDELILDYIDTPYRLSTITFRRSEKRSDPQK